MKNSIVMSSQIAPGMIVSVGDKLFRVESSVKVTVTKGAPFVKTKLRNLITNEVIEKSFKPDQTIKEVALTERTLEYLYLEGSDYLFLDIDSLDQVAVTPSIVGEQSNYLKEGVALKACFYGDTIFSVELPQFLELSIARVEGSGKEKGASATRVAILETGARVQVPPFIEPGDVIKVDTKTSEYIQRV